MDRAVDIVLFAAAIVAGSVLFIFGKRYIEKTARSKYAARFIVFVSMVIVFLTGVFASQSSADETKAVPDKPAAAAEEKAKKNSELIKNAQWRRAVMTWNNVRLQRVSNRTLSKDQLDAAQKEFASAAAALDGLAAQGVVSEKMRDYVKFEMDDEFAQLVNRVDGKAITNEEIAARFAKRLKLQSDIMAELKADSNFDKNIAEKLRQSLSDSFAAVKKVPFAERLKGSGLSKDEYRKLLESVCDNALNYIKKSLAASESADKPAPGPISAPVYGVQPIAVSKYGARPMPGPLTPPQATTAITQGSEGDISVRQAGGVWASLGAGATVSITTILENKKDDVEGKVTFTTGKIATIEKGAIAVGWEFLPDLAVEVQDNLLSAPSAPQPPVYQPGPVMKYGVIRMEIK